MAARAADDLTIYPVKYRSADELIRVAEPIFFGRATFSSLNEKIVISAPAKTTVKVLALFKELDRRPRMYGVSARLVSKAEAEAEAKGLGISIEGRRGKISQKSPPSSSQGKTFLEVGGARATLESREAVSASRTDQSLEVLEGKQAFLLQGSTFFPGGFAVKVLSAGTGRVTVELGQREGNANPAVALSTEVSFPLGRWQEVGRVSGANQNSRGEILSQGSGSSVSRKVIQVKVEAR
jgi:hypothetical protein